MRPKIGCKYLLDNNLLVYVCGTDGINQLAQVGIPDDNNIIWDRKWVEYERLQIEGLKMPKSEHTPLWRIMHDSFWQCPQENWRLSSAYMIRAVAKWIEERQVEDYAVLLPDVREVIERLTAEAKRAEKGE